MPRLLIESLSPDLIQGHRDRFVTTIVVDCNFFRLLDMKRFLSLNPSFVHSAIASTLAARQDQLVRWQHRYCIHFDQLGIGQSSWACFWQSRFRAVRILDESSLLACAAYVDLNAIRTAMAETLEESDFTSVQRRIEACQEQHSESSSDRFLAPLPIHEGEDAPGPCGSVDASRCSNKGFLPMSLTDYLQLLDWTAREVVSGKRGSTPAHLEPILARLSLSADTWSAMVMKFGQLFIHVAGDPRTVDAYRGPKRDRRFRIRSEARQLLTPAATTA